MDKLSEQKNCSSTACQSHCKVPWCALFGVLLLVLATVLTFVTWSGLGIFGMFLAGLALCCCKHMTGKRCGCCCGCGCGTVEREHNGG